MASVLGILRPFGAFLRVKEVDIYNNVFKLHSKLTFMMLLVFSALVSTNEFFGKPMDCVGDRGDRKPYFDNLCWINGTYTVAAMAAVGGVQVGRIGQHFVAPGVEQGSMLGDRTYHYYYQWVNLLLFGLAIVSYVPAYMWKIWEHGHMQMLCRGLDTPLEPTDYATRRATILKYLQSDNYRLHTIYAIRFAACEVLNLLCVFLNMFLLHLVIDRFWSRFAPAIGAMLHADRSAWTHHTAAVFPKVAKCEYNEFGPSGSIQRLDFMCVLSLNVLNEKIFAVLWLWLVALLGISALNVLYRCACLSSATLRVRLLQAQVQTGSLTAADVRTASNGATVGEWFVLYQLGRNVHVNVLRDIVEELAVLKHETKEYGDGYA